MLAYLDWFLYLDRCLEPVMCILYHTQINGFVTAGYHSYVGLIVVGMICLGVVMDWIFQNPI